MCLSDAFGFLLILLSRSSAGFPTGRCCMHLVFGSLPIQEGKRQVKMTISKQGGMSGSFYNVALGGYALRLL